MLKNKKKEEFEKIFSLNLRSAFHEAVQEFETLQEIRLRPEGPMLLKFRDGVRYLSKDKRLCTNAEEALMIPVSEIRETMEYVSNYSLYAFEEEIKNGYLTINGGHRIGIAGKVNYEDKAINGIKYISYLCIRLAHEIRGCADSVIGDLFVGNEFLDTLIFSPPGYGKTTLLRDIIRSLSNGCKQRPGGYQIGVVDERSEIAASYMGIPQNDIGIHTDVYDSCPKPIGIMYLLRSMSPQIIAVDELAGEYDIEAIEKAFGCGCRILATAHAGSLREMLKKTEWKRVMDLQMFQRFIMIDVSGSIPQYRVFDACGKRVDRKE